MRFLDQAIIGQGLRAVTFVGTTFRRTALPIGKILLSALPRTVLRRMLPDTLESRTEQTITDPDTLIEELDLIASEGVAVDREEHEVGISAVAALIVDDANNHAAISIAMPTARFTAREEYFMEAVRTGQRMTPISRSFPTIESGSCPKCNPDRTIVCGAADSSQFCSAFPAPGQIAIRLCDALDGGRRCRLC
ncbi:MAG: IclR family transcriptional regulator C-terminal domain-containing protein [Gammaproteobacteria bacterium]|nr:IclR family transcriptional regulator C-terminal domain-containing protein [Gammaproteobacteria bacterium]